MESRAIDFEKYYREIFAGPSINIKGRVTQIIGLVMEVSGISPPVGELCLVEATGDAEPVLAEVVGFRQGRALLMPLGDTRGVGPGCFVQALGEPFFVKAGSGLLGK
ncbi:MAG: EscN/YscN/HrcN family type III secretion system ATPase, partial [Firmicutes bacterium]|nr:EscN/YscN/HrcN family type III secretion system ATPase [Bacillota bacterium]